VPELTSIHAARRRGPYGDSRYRGNCGGYLIRDLLRYFRPRLVLDPMTGSGTCRDVCRELGIKCVSADLRGGKDAADPAAYAGLPPANFVWLHPPYRRMIRYNDDPRCLSNAKSLDDFLNRMQLVLRNCRSVLTPGGRIAVLIGGYSDRGRYQPLPALLVERANREGLWPACTEIIRLQHGNTSSKRRYRSSFIPGLHDTGLVFAAG
jgi:DNA modification methylase